jgi:hypothetical protein
VRALKRARCKSRRGARCRCATNPVAAAAPRRRGNVSSRYEPTMDCDLDAKARRASSHVPVRPPPPCLPRGLIAPAPPTRVASLRADFGFASPGLACELAPPLRSASGRPSSNAGPSKDRYWGSSTFGERPSRSTGPVRIVTGEFDFWRAAFAKPGAVRIVTGSSTFGERPSRSTGRSKDRYWEVRFGERSQKAGCSKDRYWGIRLFRRGSRSAGAVRIVTGGSTFRRGSRSAGAVRIVTESSPLPGLSRSAGAVRIVTGDFGFGSTAPRNAAP